MKRARVVVFVVAALLAGALAIALWSRQPSVGSGSTPSRAPLVVADSPGNQGAARPASVQPSPGPNQPATPGGRAPLPAAALAPGAALGALDPLVMLGTARRMVGDYHTLVGENPVGTNAEITHALMGGNPREATLIPPEDRRFNDQGELLDQWGTPYFFHQLSGDLMEIHSAGPDKIMGTADDLVIH